MLRGLRRLHRFEKRILEIAKKNEKLVKIHQYGFSRKTSNGFRFPIYALSIGKPAALKKNPVGIVAGVHGLETIGVRILLDFLYHCLDNPDFFPELHKGKLGLLAMPMVNPGGVALRRRSNPAGVDLMRNSGVEAVRSMPFFGGHRASKHLPYFRGQGLEPESRTLYRFVFESFFHVKNSLVPVVDVHSGFGSVDHVWWPYAGTKDPCRDHQLFEAMGRFFKIQAGHSLLNFGPQSESYTTHGDLWDLFYDHYYKLHEREKAWKSKFLPLTLEVGTWSDLKESPGKIFDRKNIFNPDGERKRETIQRYRKFLRDLFRVALTKEKDWQVQ
ncbi:MAG: DUF2817 domain-containing protein [Leptospiraceae bacterium]|nr:DUF2817 domain-containing protein [Leptospiraceae bacterium]